VKFYRDGAKYVCNKCRKKFFGREEVVSCFDNHGPEEDSWVSGRAVSQEQQRDSNESPKNPNLDALRVQRAAIKSDEEKFTRDGAKYVCRSCSKKYFTRTEVLECFDKHLNQAENENSAPKENSEADGAVTVIEEKIKELRPGGEEKFFRDGAKYVCKSCKAKFFTRPEVIACFDKH
ncbi:MAG: hypothetical protein NTX25_17755, partial [Proteobacteria bacterium]|nr:hypothetical protein [Pseudomonadota bacterium]